MISSCARQRKRMRSRSRPSRSALASQTPPDRLARHRGVVGQPDHLARQQIERPALASRRRAGAGRRDQQRRLLSRQLARGTRTGFLAEGGLQIAFHEAPLGPIHRRAADRDDARDLLVAHSGIRRQKGLRALELACRVLAAAHHRGQLGTLGCIEFHPVAYVHRRSPLSRTTMKRAAESAPEFTQKQGQYLAFIDAYTLVTARPPAQADIQRFFRVTPPTVHQMLLTLEKAQLISRKPGVARSIVVLVERDQLPRLHPAQDQTVKSYVTRY